MKWQKRKLKINVPNLLIFSVTLVNFHKLWQLWLSLMLPFDVFSWTWENWYHFPFCLLHAILSNQLSVCNLYFELHRWNMKQDLQAKIWADNCLQQHSTLSMKEHRGRIPHAMKSCKNVFFFYHIRVLYAADGSMLCIVVKLSLMKK